MDKGKGKGKGGPPRAPPDPAAKEKLKAEQAAKKAELEAEMKFQQEQEQRQKAFGEKLSACRPCSISSVDWAKAETMYHLVGGKGTGDGGVTAVLIGADEVVMVRSQEFAQEMVALAVANCMGVRVAQFRMLHFSEDMASEWQVVNETMKRVDPRQAQFEKEMPKYRRMAEQNGWGEMWEKFKLYFQKSKAVLEFIPGTPLDTALSGPVQPSEDMFSAMGRLCALDLLLNNMDRVPLPLWDNPLGNLSNIMVGADGAVVGIDQQVNLITDEDGMAEYLQRVRQFVTHLMRNDFAHMKMQEAETKVQSAILEVSKAEVSRECAQALLRGIREGLVSFAEKWADGAFEAALKEVSEAAKLVKDGATATGEDYAAFVRQIAEAVAPLVREAGRKDSIS